MAARRRPGSAIERPWYTLCIYVEVRLTIQTKVQKWGNSLGVRIPRSVAAGARLTAGASVEISASDESVVIRLVDRPRYRLSDLLKGIKRSNLHEEADTGPAVGRELL